MSYRNVPLERDGYAVYASVQSIDAYLKDAHANLRRAQREVAWLQALRDHRAGQSTEQWLAEVRAYERDSVIAAGFIPLDTGH